MRKPLALLFILTLGQPAAAAPPAGEYVEFALRNSGRGGAAAGRDFAAAYEQALRDRRAGIRKTAADLRGAILAGLGLGGLLSGLKAGSCSVKTLSRRDAGAYTETRLLFTGLPTGGFTALLLLPAGKSGPLPAVAGLHGHGESAALFRDKYSGAELAASGFAVILPDFRAMEGGAEERAAHAALYDAGFTLMGMRVYETLLAADYLVRAGISRPGAVALLGHSGGSSAALLAARLSPDLGALAVDMNLDLLSVFQNERGGPHCETVPALAPYDDQVNDLSTLHFPARLFRYGYPGAEEKAGAAAFLRRALQGESARRGRRALPARAAFWDEFPMLASLRRAGGEALPPAGRQLANCLGLERSGRRYEALLACQAAAADVSGGVADREARCEAAVRAAGLLAGLGRPEEAREALAWAGDCAAPDGR